MSVPGSPWPGRFTVDELHDAVRAGDIEKVVAELPAWRAASKGKRCSPGFILDEVDILSTLLELVIAGIRERGWGRVIMSTSSGVIEPVANLGLSNTLRASLAGWSKTLARKVAADGVTVNIIIPDSSPPAASDSWIKLKRPVCSSQRDGLEPINSRSVRNRNSAIRLSS